MLFLLILIGSSWALGLFSFGYYWNKASQITVSATYRTDYATYIIEKTSGLIRLPNPINAGTMSVEEAMFRRRSKREYVDKPLEVVHLSQLLWASQGITEPNWGLRTAPSAGGTYPLEIYMVVGERCVKDLMAGVYRYNPKDHTIVLVASGDCRQRLSDAALNQSPVANAPVDIVVAAVYERTTRTYGSRGVRYVDMEAGHAGQNVYLIATAMGLGAVVIGAFHDEQVQQILQLPRDQAPLYVIPVGYPR
jgi:SagB-type dehydrogenase family enzyme